MQGIGLSLLQPTIWGKYVLETILAFYEMEDIRQMEIITSSMKNILLLPIDLLTE